MSAAQLHTANFAKMNLNTKQEVPVLTQTNGVTPSQMPLQLTMPTLNLLANKPVSVTPMTSAPVSVTPMTSSVVAPVASVVAPVVAPVSEFVIQLNSIDEKLVSQSTQEQQYAIAGFSFKEPRVKTALIEATVDKNLQRTLDNIEKAKGEFNGQGSIPLDRLSADDQAVIQKAREEYTELVKYRSDADTGGVKQFNKELMRKQGMVFLLVSLLI